MATKHTLASLLRDERIAELARPSNIRYGTAIYKRGAVKVIAVSATRIEAWVGGLDGSIPEGGGQRRRTTLFVDDGELRWSCTESIKPDLLFCKHCVALSLRVMHGASD
jgi:hypothetical protein